MSSDDTRQRGVLADWNDERGFGFITPSSGAKRAFAHVSAFPRGQRPVRGCEVSYVEVRDERNRLQAAAIRYLRPVPSGGHRWSAVWGACAVTALFFALLTGLVHQALVPQVLLATYGLVSTVTFAVYAGDKSAATQGKWRTSESTLHSLALLGGWPGALIARQVFRHKTVKQPFRTIFWMTVAANCAGLAWFAVASPVTLP